MDICIYSISPKKGGGVITKTILLIKYLKSLGHKVDWYYPNARGKVPRYIQDFVAEYEVITKEIFAIPYLRSLDALDPFGQIPKKYDIYQVVSGFCFDGMVFRQVKNKYFIWSASTISSEKFGASELRLLNLKNIVSLINIKTGFFLEEKYAKLSYKVIANSEVTKAKISRDLDIEKKDISVIYPLIDLDKYAFRPMDRRLLKEKYILFVGIFSKRKNIDLLLRSFKLVANRQKDVRLKLVGNPNGFLDEYQKQCQDLDIESRVDFVGEVKDNYDYYSNALLTALSSVEEGFGMVMAESIACGTPVVSTRCGGVSEIVNHGVNGFLTSSNPQDMSRFMLKIIEDPELRSRMSQAGRSTIKDKFSAEVGGEKFLKEYQAFIDEH